MVGTRAHGLRSLSTGSLGHRYPVTWATHLIKWAMYRYLGIYLGNYGVSTQGRVPDRYIRPHYLGTYSPSTPYTLHVASTVLVIAYVYILQVDHLVLVFVLRPSSSQLERSDGHILT